MVKTKTPKVVKKAVKKVVKKDGECSLDIVAGDVHYKGSADSFVEALTDFTESKNYPEGAKVLTVVNFSKGKEKRTEIWRVQKSRRMFNLLKMKPSVVEMVARKMEAQF